MPRTLRHNLPGVAFHITARIQGHAALFAGLEKLVVARIDNACLRSDAGLLAFAVMPNHLHIVLRQGRQRLSEFMQPMLTRVALLVQRRTGVEGHVFERRYFASPCFDADYLRNAIAYVHLNGLRAGIVASIDDFAWSTHARYGALLRTRNPDTHIESGLRLFASECGQSLRDCHSAYRRFLEWRCAEDVHCRRVEEGIDSTAPERPRTDGGDEHWLRMYAVTTVSPPEPTAEARLDMTELAHVVLRDVAPDVAIESLRSADQRRRVVRARRLFIVRAHEAGHQGSRIAAYLGISHPSVSRTITEARCPSNCKVERQAPTRP